MTGVLALHGAGGSAERFRDQLRHIASDLSSWQIPSACKDPEPLDKIHYAGLGAAAYRLPCWDIEALVRAGRDKVILGFSMGAITAMRVLQASPACTRAVVCIAGCHSMMQLLGEPYTPPSGFKGAVLFIHGTADRKIPPALANECAKALERSGASVDYWAVPDAGHSFGQLGLAEPSPTAHRLRQWIEDRT
ncbi:prolyl oligopeptidase family serine peptidase [Glycomyces sp. TRM65418]|uniref:alpha/beta hydrolase n=1 Tax=Glycomyces sp. TRM65418 TaxID=2867006 RepID=UPI001CE6C05F|nr:prolyl oligopeptidase family serine peptidase [Glycomyces sp. TRM65418]MCC3765505.1 prolyl oligopeptidase family serine peptidase [Glycomyces sp. TRM65418]QZD55112.1 prolyl oligopeptidase family serine peptidase [Glycomyces sp. TRM65418]